MIRFDFICNFGGSTYQLSHVGSCQHSAETLDFCCRAAGRIPPLLPPPRLNGCTATAMQTARAPHSPRGGAWLWRVQLQRVYAAALAHDYRFLSYGDSSLLIPSRFCAAPGDADGPWQRL